jgi:uroporphyrinogen-III synthase
MPPNRPVVVTRPLAQAEPLAQRIAASGRNAIVFPLLEIRPLQDDAPLRAALADPAAYAMVVFVSPNAVDAACAIVTEWPRAVALAVIGEGSRQALARHGISDANASIRRPSDPLRSDSETLLQTLDLASLRGKRVLIVRGESGRELLADALRDAGAEVFPVAAYRREAPAMTDARSKQLRAFLASPHDWIITSSEALHVLTRMVRESHGESGVVKMQQQTLICPHARIRETAETLGFHDIILTASGDEQLLAALQSRP